MFYTYSQIYIQVLMFVLLCDTVIIIISDIFYNVFFSPPDMFFYNLFHNVIVFIVTSSLLFDRDLTYCHREMLVNCELYI